MRKIVTGLLVVAILFVVTGCGNKSTVNFIKNDDWNLVNEVTPDENGVIQSYNQDGFGLIVVEDEEIKEYISLTSDYNTSNDDYKYYKISLYEFDLTCESSLSYKNNDYNYEIKILTSISEPITFFQSNNVIKTDTKDNIMKGFTKENLFANSLKDVLEQELNPLITKYLDENDMEFSSNEALANYVSYSLDEIVQNAIGLNIKSVEITIK